MNYPAIRIEGAILSSDILEKLDDAVGQRPTDFGFESTVKVNYAACSTGYSGPDSFDESRKGRCHGTALEKCDFNVTRIPMGEMRKEGFREWLEEVRDNWEDRE